MIGSFIKTVVMVGISAVLAMFLVYAFDDWYQDLERRRRAKWQRKYDRRDHPANSGPRYE